MKKPGLLTLRAADWCALCSCWSRWRRTDRNPLEPLEPLEPETVLYWAAFKTYKAHLLYLISWDSFWPLAQRYWKKSKTVVSIFSSLTTYTVKMIRQLRAQSSVFCDLLICSLCTPGSIPSDSPCACAAWWGFFNHNPELTTSQTQALFVVVVVAPKKPKDNLIKRGKKSGRKKWKKQKRHFVSLFPELILNVVVLRTM